jgi:preprotein translocase subunit SecF
MLQVFHNANFRFMWGTKWYFIVLSVAAMTVAAGAIAVRGFNYGIDFAGGTAVQLKFRDDPHVEELRSVLEAERLGDVSIQRIGDPEDREVLIRVEQQQVKGGSATTEGGEISTEILAALRTREEREALEAGRVDLNGASEDELRDWLAARLGAAGEGSDGAPAVAAAVAGYRTDHGGIIADPAVIATIPGVTPAAARLLGEQGFLGRFALRQTEFVGPTAGEELLRDTVYAILGSTLGILIYVWVRFHKVAWGVAAIMALVHDVIVSAGAMAITGKEFSLPVVAALLTILGYSINDTIVIFDRIRENLRLYRDQDFEVVVNASVNQTLSRSVLTSFTVFVAVTALFLYGGDKLNPLSFCLMVGVVCGSYSTIFVAAALLVIAYQRLGARHVKA